MARRLPRLIGRLIRLGWRANPRDLLITIVFNLVSGVFTAFGLLATTKVLTALFAAGPTPERVRGAAPALFMVGAAIALRASCTLIAQWAQMRLRPQIQRLVELRLYEATTAIDLAALDDSDHQDALQRARIRGVESASEMTDDAVDIGTAGISVAAAAGTLGVLHPALLPLLLLTAVPEAWAAIRSARICYIAQMSLVEVRRRSWIMAELMTERRQAAEIRSFTMRPFLLRRYGQLADHIREVMLDVARRRTGTQLLGDVLRGVATVTLYVVLGLMLWGAVMPLAVAGTAVLAIRTSQASLLTLVHALNRCYEHGLYFQDYIDYCAMAEQSVAVDPASLKPATTANATPRTPLAADEPAPATGDPLGNAGSHNELHLNALLRFRQITATGITFTYPGADAPALRDVSVRLGRGEVVALVGENGSGKTTLAKVLAALYRPDKGDIHWDDQNAWDLDLHLLRQAVAVIAQDHTRWPMSAGDNIAMGDDLTDARIQARTDAAAAAAGADEVLAGLPHGTQTLLDRRFADGVDLSGGQWQRLAAARGFYRNAPLLICDEPTAALDAKAEHRMFEQIRTHAREHRRTVLLITHRLSNARLADQIYVLANGSLIDHGTHQDLMNRHGLYADLYTLQASAFGQPT
ncbi:ABC transporter ATP-binding protein [Actinomadura harenae]|uniref:ABC transporter ATP-binding protein n=2 Tax=Actinomadura harenae TaxID=2483351 RepID=A0A3M2M6W7_9ACTN|nr:ABC transporter ATP-binding protein [Actinomadura harenae]